MTLLCVALGDENVEIHLGEGYCRFWSICMKFGWKLDWDKTIRLGAV